MFVWEDGRPLRPDWVSRRFKTLVDSSGVTAYPPAWASPLACDSPATGWRASQDCAARR